jgi:hypothetical protein
VTALSAAGSRFASENVVSGPDVETTWQTRMRAVTDRWRAHGFNGELNDLWYGGERHDVGAYLRGRGWETTGITVGELFGGYGLDMPDIGEAEHQAAASDTAAYIRATRLAV